MTIKCQAFITEDKKKSTAFKEAFDEHTRGEVFLTTKADATEFKEYLDQRNLKYLTFLVKASRLYIVFIIIFIQ